MAATATAVVLVGTVGSSAFSSPAYSSRVTRTATAASVSSVSKADLSRIVDADTARRRAANDPGVPGSTPLRMIVDEQREFELALGKAVDTLKKDYPDILKADPGMFPGDIQPPSRNRSMYALTLWESDHILS